MSADSFIDRRRLLKTIAAGGAIAKWPALASVASGPGEAKIAYAVISPEQAALLEALVDQFIPTDDYPGAKDAGVVHYIDQKLAGPFGSFFVTRYQDGLRQINEASRREWRHDFVALDAEQQASLLHGIDERTYGEAAQEFLQTLLSDTFEGYYGNPQDGGNRDGLSWKMIGFRG